MSERLLIALGVLLAALALGLGLFWHPEPASRPVAVATMPPGGDFTLQAAGGPVSLADFRGRLTLIYFGYTYCPDICPTTLSTLSAGITLLTPEERARLAILFVSVDPQRDTPEHLKTYVEFFDPSMVGVTGSPAEIAEVARRYGVTYIVQAPETEGAAYVIDHSSDTFVVAADSRLLARLPHGTQPEHVAALIRQYLNQP